MAPSNANKRQSKPKAKKGAPTIRDPDAKPKRPLSAYNLFFQFERDMMLRSKPSKAGQSHEDMHMTIANDPSERRNRSKTVRPPPHGKVGFAELAKAIGGKWKSLDDDSRKHFQGLAAIEKKRYVKEVEEWKARMASKNQEGETKKLVGKKPKGKSHQEQDNGTRATPAQESPLHANAAVVIDQQAHREQNRRPSREEMYTLLDRACEIADFAPPEPVHSQQSYSYSNDGRYAAQSYQQQSDAFSPPPGGPHRTQCSPNIAPNGPYQGYDAKLPIMNLHRELHPTSMYQHTWTVPGKIASGESAYITSKPPRAVSIDSSSNNYYLPKGHGADVVETGPNIGDTDILDFLSRIVSD